ncbi:MAG: hypothetical protein SGI71_04290 [Verrucomicrobiota bacterium]|nr:hypothetical protein [Verrucomicrobiota bacterium]
MKIHTEARLEDAIIDHLITKGGYTFVDYREFFVISLSLSFLFSEPQR